jgi:hypothetical protein
MARPAVLVAIAALALAGCGSESHPAGERTGELVVSVEPAEFPDHLEDTECFAAVPGVAVLAESNGPPAVCDDVAARVLQGRERLSWPPALLRDPDATTECLLARGDEKVAVARSTADTDEGEAAYELAERICTGLRKDGWKQADWGP